MASDAPTYPTYPHASPNHLIPPNGSQPGQAANPQNNQQSFIQLPASSPSRTRLTSTPAPPAADATNSIYDLKWETVGQACSDLKKMFPEKHLILHPSAKSGRSTLLVCETRFITQRNTAGYKGKVKLRPNDGAMVDVFVVRPVNNPRKYTMFLSDGT